MNSIQLHLGYAGYCLSKEKFARRGGKFKDITFHALFGIIKHPKLGYILFDTGYSTQFYSLTQTFPENIFAKITEVFVTPEEEVSQQLSSAGIPPEDIKHVILSHFHPDHIGGIRHFPNATFYCSKKAIEQWKRVPANKGIFHGLMHGLFPEDFKKRYVCIEDVGTKQADAIFGETYDLFDDQTIICVPLPGHGAGQFGIQIETSKNKFFLSADASWLKINHEELILPHPLVRLMVDSWNDYVESLKRLHQFHLTFPEVIIVPTHCKETTDALVREEIRFDAL